VTWNLADRAARRHRGCSTRPEVPAADTGNQRKRLVGGPAKHSGNGSTEQHLTPATEAITPPAELKGLNAIRFIGAVVYPIAP
jgi:hypothetical protein